MMYNFYRFIDIDIDLSVQIIALETWGTLNARTPITIVYVENSNEYNVDSN